MDPTHLQLTQASQQYGLHPELTSASYGTPIALPRLQRSILESHSSISPSAPGELPWPQRIPNEARDLLLLLSPDGVIHYVSPSCKAITGFDTPNLERDYISRFIHDDDKPVFARELRESVAMARPFHCHFRMYQVDNSTCLLEAYGHAHFEQLNNDASGTVNLNQSQQQQFCQGIFLVCRPYHNESKHLFDSFLEHKLENIRLKERIAQLKREEESDLVAVQQNRFSLSSSSYAQLPIPQTNKPFVSKLDTSLLPGGGAGDDNEFSDTLDNINEMGLGMGQDQATAARGQKEGGEEMPASTISHFNDVELLTGLYLTRGERSQGISTGTSDGRLYNLTTTNSNPSSRVEQRALVVPGNEPRKKLKAEYKCADCGTSDSPEWRRGPEGPKTLCNACGLRWAKMEKKRQDLGF
ncbi:hypothetical protein BDW75DRAFT_207314 [Aspergillus navahoensis]